MIIKCAEEGMARLELYYLWKDYISALIKKDTEQQTCNGCMYCTPHINIIWRLLAKKEEGICAGSVLLYLMDAHIANSLCCFLQEFGGGHSNASAFLQERVDIEKGREGLWQSRINSQLKSMYDEMSFYFKEDYHTKSHRNSYHKVSCNIGLENTIERALGKCTFVKREDFGHVLKALLIMPWSNQVHSVLIIVLWGPHMFCAWRIEDFAQIHRDIIPFWVARVCYNTRQSLRLQKGKETKI